MFGVSFVAVPGSVYGAVLQYRRILPKNSGRTASVQMKLKPAQLSVDRNVEHSTGPRILGLVFVLVGLVLVCLSVLLPILMEAATQRRGVGGAFMPGYLRSLTPFITNASIASSFVATTVILSFEKSRPTGASVLFGVLTLAVFAGEISLSLYLSLVRPSAPTVPTVFETYALIGLVPFGLACTMFTLASLLPART